MYNGLGMHTKREISVKIVSESNYTKEISHMNIILQNYKNLINNLINDYFSNKIDSIIDNFNGFSVNNYINLLSSFDNNMPSFLCSAPINLL